MSFGAKDLRLDAEAEIARIGGWMVEGSPPRLLRDYNQRVVQDRLRPVFGRSVPVVAPRVDVEEMVARWEELRRQRDEAAARDRPEPSAPPPQVRRAWPWAWLRRGR